MKLNEIQYARAFAMVAVLFVHFSSTGLGGSPIDSAQSYGYGLINSIGRLGVPVFFLLSGLVLFYSTNKRPFNAQTIKTFYQKRIKFIVIPYVVISLFYFISTWIIFYDYTAVQAIKFYIERLFTGQTHMHLYFLFVLLQFYIVFPILFLAFKKSKMPAWVLIIISIAIQFAWVVVNQKLGLVQNRSIVFLTYFAFFGAGGAIGLYYMQIRESLSKASLKVIAPILFIISVILMATYDRLARTGGIWSYITDGLVVSRLFDILWTLLGLTATLCFLVIGKMILDKGMPKTEGFLNKVADYSFGIYLLHPFFLMIFERLIPANTPLIFHSWQLFTAIAVTILSWIATAIIKKLKFGWVLIGK